MTALTDSHGPTGPSQALPQRGPWRAGWLHLAVAALLLLAASLASAQMSRRDFDHARTGYPLSGMHANARCESCHVNGVLKGTPRDCGSCHTAGSRWSRANVVQPTGHLPTQSACDTCHGLQSFSGARFSHTGVAAGSCATCHNGSVTAAAAKPAAHVQTSASCDRCHKTAGWQSASGFDHTSVSTGNLCHLPQRRARHRQAGPACAGTGRPGLRQLPPLVQCVATRCVQPHADGRGRPVQHLPQRRLPAGRWATGDPHPVPDALRRGDHQLRQLPARPASAPGRQHACTPACRSPANAPPATPAALRPRWASPTPPSTTA